MGSENKVIRLLHEAWQPMLTGVFLFSEEIKE